MGKRHHSFYSPALGRDMAMDIHGHAGKPCLVFPSQDGRYWDYENFGMLEPCTRHLREGKIRLYCVDGIDSETRSNTMMHPWDRLLRHEQCFGISSMNWCPLSGRRPERAHDDHQLQHGRHHAVNTLFRRY